MVQQEEPRSFELCMSEFEFDYECCDDILQPVVDNGHDTKLPLTYHATFRMKEFCDYKAEMYLGAVLRGASAQGATTQDTQQVYRREFIKSPFYESDLL